MNARMRTLTAGIIAAGIATSTAAAAPPPAQVSLERAVIKQMNVVRAKFNRPVLKPNSALIRAIAASARMAALSYLRISYSDVGADGARALAASRAPKLDGLDLRLTRVGEEGMAALAGSEALRRVSGLHLSEARLGAAGVRALAEHFRGERLEQLDLAHNRSARRLSPDWQVGPDACSALVSARFMQTVRSLDLAGNALGADGARAVATSPRLGSLRVLDLTMNAIGDAGVEALLSSGLVHRLDRLRLQHDDTIGEEAFDALIDTCEAHGVELEL